jgi:hypothetical protein
MVSFMASSGTGLSMRGTLNASCTAGTSPCFRAFPSFNSPNHQIEEIVMADRIARRGIIGLVVAAVGLCALTGPVAATEMQRRRRRRIVRRRGWYGRPYYTEGYGYPAPRRRFGMTPSERAMIERHETPSSYVPGEPYFH